MSSTTAANETSLDGRAVIITGASRGIGLACARALAEQGARLQLVARNAEAAARAVAEFAPRANVLRADLGRADDLRRVLPELRAAIEGNSVYAIVNNAGRFTLAPVEETSVEDFAETVAVNVTAYFAMIREFLPAMREHGAGHIVTIGSIADHVALPGNAAYAASKFGARALHEVLREELRGSGVRATLVSPGPVDTSLWDAVDPDARPGFTPRSQMLSAAAVADAVRYVLTRPADVNIDELRLSRT